MVPPHSDTPSAASRPLSRYCLHHPERPARAQCMQCSSGICEECATSWQGINYCTRCLGRLREAERESGSVVAALGVAAVVLLLCYLMAQVMVWSAVLVASLS